MKLFSLFLGFLLLPFMAYADIEPSTLEQADEIHLGEEKTFLGKPAIVTEPVEIKPTEEPIIVPSSKPTLQPATIHFQTPFGHDRTALFLDHTTDFVVLVQILDSNTIKVEEHIQFITTRDLPNFQRIYSLPDITVLSVMTGKSPLSFSVDNGKLTTTTPVPAGFHNYTITYLIHQGIAVDHTLATLTIPLTGFNWPQVTERFSIVLLLPQSGTIYTNELLFGSNNQKIDGAVLITPDLKGNIVYQLKQPLPAFAEVKLHLIADPTVIPPAQSSFYTTYLIPMLYSLIIVIYTLLSILTARHKKYINPLKTARKTIVSLWVGLLEDSRLKPSKRIRWSAFIWFNMEYILGFLILIGCMIILAHHYQFTYSYWWLITPALIGLYAIHYFGTKAELKNRLSAFYHLLMDTPHGLNLPQRDIPTYYQIACHLGFGTEWERKLHQYNPSSASILEKEKSL